MNKGPVSVTARSKGAATLEPELTKKTQQTKHLSGHISPDKYGYF